MPAYQPSPLMPMQQQQQMQPQQGMQPPQYADALAQLSPEDRAQVMGLGSLDDESSSLEAQLAQARALRTRAAAPKEYNSIGSAGLGSLADIINAASAGAKERDALDRQAAIRGQQTAGRSKLGDAYTQALQSALLRRQAAPPPTEDQAFLQGLPGLGGGQ